MQYKKILEYNYKQENNIILQNKKVPFYCRFCGKIKTKEDFRKKAHAVAECIGNKSIFSKYECDECNEKFAKREENELGNLTKLYRATRGIEGKKGKIKLNSGIDMGYNDNNFHMSVKDVKKLKNEISLKMLNGNISEIEISNDIKVNTLLIYRAFLKFALSIVPEDISLKMETGYKMIRNDIPTISSSMHIIIMKNPISNPTIALYELQKNSEFPKYFCTIDAYQRKYVIFMDFDTKIKFIPYDFIKDDLEIDTDNIYKIVQALFDNNELSITQKEKIIKR